MWDPRRRFLKAWMLPLIVVGLVVPGAAGMVIGGPGIGIAVGGLCALLLVIVAALQRPQGEIEIAPAPDALPHLLVIAIEALEEPAVVERILAAAQTEGDAAEILVVAPARGSALSQWLSDVEPARDEAQVRLVHSIAALLAAGLDARGEVGDPDPLQAAEDTLRSFPATEVMIVASEHDRVAPRAGEELRRRLRVPLTELTSGAVPQPG